MPWICPNCNRSFKKVNQDHSCFSQPIEEHFLYSQPSVYACFQQIDQFIMSQEVTRASVKHAILYTLSSNFLALKPHKNHLDIEFILPYAVNEFPVYKTVIASKNRIAHFVSVHSVDEVDDQLFSWMKAALENNRV